LNGRCLDSQSADTHEALLALAYYHITSEGTVGEAFNGIPVMWRPAGEPADSLPRGDFRKDHEYCVIQRAVEGDRIVLRLTYQPKEKEREQS
jgi:hypothetical protein